MRGKDKLVFIKLLIKHRNIINGSIICYYIEPSKWVFGFQCIGTMKLLTGCYTSTELVLYVYIGHKQLA